MVRGMTTRILIVDDHPLVRQGLIGLISTQRDFEVCGEASGVVQARQMAAAMRPDVAIVDLTLKDGSGIELLKEFREQYEETKLLVISMHDESLFAERRCGPGPSATSARTTPFARSCGRCAPCSRASST